MKLDRILAVKLADLGDVLLTEPALRSLRTAYPRADIDVLTTPAAAPLVALLDGSVGVIPFSKDKFDTLDPRRMLTGSASVARLSAKLRNGSYDAVAVFHHLATPAGAVKFRALTSATGARIVAGLDNGRGTFLTHRAIDLGFGAKHVVDYMLQVSASIGGAKVPEAPQIQAPPVRIDSGASDVKGRFALVFPTTGPYAPGRNWPAESFAALAGLLSEERLPVVIAGTSEASSAAETILDLSPAANDLTGATSLNELVHLVRRASIVITGDSFPAHLAAALGRPLVTIFGPSNHRAWGPYGADVFPKISSEGSTILRRDVPCAPCLYTGYRLGRRNGCASRICLTGIAPEDVMQAVRTVLDGHQ